MLSFLLLTVLAQQGHSTEPQQAMKDIAFMKGEWKGKQDFNTGGDKMVGAATDSVNDAIGGRYLEERLSTTLPGRAPTDTRHMITFDPVSQKYRAWWFNDTAVGPMEFAGKVEGGKLVLMSTASPESPQRPTMRATYSSPAADQLVFTLEMDAGGKWQLLFTSTYSK
jgi:Protein of unknown function (DUF1579)